MKIKQAKAQNQAILKRALSTAELFEQENMDENQELWKIENANLFYGLIAPNSAQSKAPSSEKFIANKLGVEKIKASLDRGDYYDASNDTYIELKNSFTNKAEKLNLRQIRLWQEVDFYYCIYIDHDSLNKSAVYVLTKDEMVEEVEIMGGFTHGTIGINAENTHSEYSITLSVKKNSNAHKQRWDKKYFDKELFKRILDMEVSDEQLQ